MQQNQGQLHDDLRNIRSEIKNVILVSNSNDFVFKYFYKND